MRLPVGKLASCRSLTRPRENAHHVQLLSIRAFLAWLRLAIRWLLVVRCADLSAGKSLAKGSCDTGGSSVQFILRRLGCSRCRVNAHLAEIVPEARLHKRARSSVER